MPNNTKPQVTGWVGWIYFAGFMMLLVGFFQIMLGLVALLNSDFYTAVNGTLVVWDFTTWGWIHLIGGVVVLLTGMSLFSGSHWARILAIILVALNLLSHFVFLSAYPVWSIAVMVIDVFIIYALTVHGKELDQ